MRKLSDKGYAGYLKALDIKIEKLMKRGVADELIPEPLSRREWEYEYVATRNDLKSAVAAGKRKVVGNVNQDMIRRQVYENSYEQSRHVLGAIREMEKEGRITKQQIPKLEDIMLGTADIDWDFISEKYHEARLTMKGSAAKKYIAQHYFGSL